MKQLTVLIIALLLTSVVTSSFAQATQAPYVADYSSSFKIGNPDNSAKVLDIWKDWDDNQLERHDYFADTLTMFMPDGTTTRGKAANLEGAKKFRGSMSKSKSTVHAWVPLHSTDTNDDIVCIWGVEEDTYADGKVELRELHEVWWFNKDGKVSMMRQWAAKFTQPK